MRRINQILLAGVLISLGMLIQCVRGGFEYRGSAVAAPDGAVAPGPSAKLTVRDGKLDSNSSATECGGWAAGRVLALSVYVEAGKEIGDQLPAARIPRQDGCITLAANNPAFAGGKYRLWVIE